MVFLAGFESIPGNNAGEFTQGRWKLLLHTTEGHNIAGAVSAYREHNSWPHFTVSFEERRRVQHVDMALPARALRSGGGVVRTNGAHVIQVEIVGFAEDEMSRDKAAWIGSEVVAPIREAIPEIRLHGPRFRGKGEGIVLATRDSPIRFTPQAWLDFDGICGHQHAPLNDHWDPGRIPLDTILDAARGTLVPDLEEIEMKIIDCPGKPALLLAGNVQALNGKQRDALRKIGVNAQAVDTETHEALFSLARAD
jgi:hypothetical protein